MLDSCDIDSGTSQDLNRNGVPDECDPRCPWDCGGEPDGHVTILDFLALLAQWGQAASSCDFAGDGVGLDDFVDLLDNWGPCP